MNARGFGLAFTVCLAVLMAGILTAAGDEARHLPPQLLDPGFLAARSWSKDPTLDALTADWPSYSGRQGFEDATITKETVLSVLGRRFRAQYRVSKTDGFVEIIAVHAEDFDEKFCVELFGVASKRLGKPATILDRSSGSRADGFVSTEADWSIGVGRIQFSCAGARVGGAFVPAISVLAYRHQSRLKALEEFVYVECSVTRRFFGNVAERPAETRPPLTFIIDPNREELLTRNKASFLDTRVFEQDRIVAGKEDEKATQSFVFDRVTGNYRWESRMKHDVKTGIELWGKCVRVEGVRQL
jgi:hypothetical protein